MLSCCKRPVEPQGALHPQISRGDIEKGVFGFLGRIRISCLKKDLLGVAAQIPAIFSEGDHSSERTYVFFKLHSCFDADTTSRLFSGALSPSLTVSLVVPHVASLWLFSTVRPVAPSFLRRLGRLKH
jgi:hypothetical protein